MLEAIHGHKKSGCGWIGKTSRLLPCCHCRRFYLCIRFSRVQPNTLELVDGGTGPQTEQTLRNIEQILLECGASLKDVVKMNVFLTDMSSFAEMNQAYMEVLGSDPPARITVGCFELALGAAVEIDCVATKPASG